MSIDGLEHFSQDQLIEELINRPTFVGTVIFHRGDAKGGRLDPGEIVITKSPPLTREGLENLLRLGKSLVPDMFGDKRPDAEGAPQALPLHGDLPPLRLDQGGVVRIGKSRITLDLIVEQYENGMAPEDIVRAYDTLELADVYAAIGYYHRHREKVQNYLKRRADEAEALRTTIEAERPRVSRDELLARRSAREKDSAATGQ